MALTPSSSLWRFPRLKIQPYALMLYLGLVSGLIAGNLAAHARGLDALAVLIVTLVLFGLGFYGTRALHVAANWRTYRRRPWTEWANPAEGGLSLVGGLLPIVGMVAPLAWLLGLPLGDLLDVLAVSLLPGLFFGKLGCWLCGCCRGRPLDWRWTRGLVKPGPRMPIEAIEMTWTLVLLAGITWALPRAPLPGALAVYTVTLVALGRLAQEPFLELRREALPLALLVSVLILGSAFAVWSLVG